MSEWRLTRIKHRFILAPPGSKYQGDLGSSDVTNAFAWLKQKDESYSSAYFVIATGEYTGWHCDDARYESFVDVIHPLERLALTLENEFSPPKPGDYPEYD